MTHLDTFRHDLGLALKSIAERRWPAALVVLTLALAIGANTALFAIVDHVLWRPLPFEHPERLVQLWETHIDSSGREGAATGNIKEWRARSKTMEGVAGWYVMGRTLKVGTDAVVVRAAQGARSAG